MPTFPRTFVLGIGLQPFWLSVFFFGTVNSGHGQDASPAPSPRHVVRFRVSEHNVPVVLMKINGSREIPMMLHTANRGITVTTQTLADFPDWEMEGESTMESWGGRRKSRWTKSAKVDIQGYRRERLLMTEDSLSGRGTQGKIGLDLFEEPVIWIDFRKGEIRTYRHPFELPVGFVNLSASVDELGWKIPIEIRLDSGATSRPCLWHTGYSKTLLLDADWANKQSVISTLPILSEKVVRDSSGKALTTKTLELPGVSIAETEFKRIPASIFPGQMAGRSHSVLGMECIRRFDWIVDRKRQRIAIRPNAYCDDPMPSTDQ